MQTSINGVFNSKFVEIKTQRTNFLCLTSVAFKIAQRKGYFSHTYRIHDLQQICYRLFLRMKIYPQNTFLLKNFFETEVSIQITFAQRTVRIEITVKFVAATSGNHRLQQSSDGGIHHKVLLIHYPLIHDNLHIHHWTILEFDALVVEKTIGGL